MYPVDPVRNIAIHQFPFLIFRCSGAGLFVCTLASLYTRFCFTRFWVAQLLSALRLSLLRKMGSSPRGAILTKPHHWSPSLPSRHSSNSAPDALPAAGLQSTDKSTFAVPEYEH